MVVEWPTLPNDVFSDGTWLIGADIEAGTYRTIPGPLRYWERLSGLSGSSEDIIANDSLTTPTYVEILATDKAFSSDGCGDWVKVE